MDKSRTEQAAGGGDISAALDPMQLRVALADLMNPAGVAAETPRLAAELILIALGITAVELPEQDARFADPAWRDNPLYRLIGQSYLAWEQSVSRLVEHFTGDWQRRERARYWADIITGGLAPTNFLPGNPAALKRAFETGGLSVARGYRNFLRDLLANSGMPQMVDTRPFTVGENLAVSPGAVVYREEMFELLQYTPTTKKVRERPLLFVPPELNRHYVLDLAPGRSMVEYAISAGMHTFMLVWRNPRLDKNEAHGHWGMDDYIAAHVRAFDLVREITGAEDLNLVGLCAGGLTSALTQAHLAARSGNLVHAATYLVTMLDARQPNMVATLDTPQADAVLAKEARKGTVIDAKTVKHNFAWMRPNDLVYSYVVNDWLLGNDAPAFDVLAWNDDATNLSATFSLDSNAMVTSGKIISPGAISLLGTPYAGITGDFYPVHVNAVYAAKQPVGERVAHGTLIAGLMSTVGGLWMLKNSIDGLSQGYNRLRFVRPVRFGDTIALAQAKVGESQDGRRVICRVEARNQDDQEADRAVARLAASHVRAMAMVTGRRAGPRRSRAPRGS